MPFAPSDASKHTKSANTNKLKALWAEVANGALKRKLGDAAAIREANAVVKRAGDKAAA